MGAYGNVIPPSRCALEVMSGMWVNYLVEVSEAGGEWQEQESVDMIVLP